MARLRFRRLNTGFRQIAGSAATVGTPALTLTILSIAGTTSGGTSTATLAFSGGAPASLAVTVDGAAALAVSGISITTNSGSGPTASGSASFSFATPAPGSHVIVAFGTGIYPSISNAWPLVTSIVVLPPPPPAPPMLTILSISGTAPGGTSSAVLSFNGGAPDSVTARLDGAALTITSVLVTTLTGLGATASGSASFSFITPAAGAHTVVATGTGTYAATSNAWSLITLVAVLPPIFVDTGTGSTAPLTTLNASDQNRVFNRDVYIGNPPGFSTNYNKGWAVVPIVVSSSVTSNGLWMRLHNAEDPTAQQNVAGSGAVLQPAVKVAGVNNLVVGSNSVSVTIPAAKAWYYLDIATDAVMSSPSRIAKVFGAGAVFGFGPGTSHGAGFSSSYAYGPGAPLISQMVDVSPYGVVYAPFRYSGIAPTPNTWQKPGNPDVSPYNTTHAAEFLRLSVNKLGVTCAFVGDTQQGGYSWQWNAPYDTNPSHYYGAMVTVLSHAGKWEVQMGLSGVNDSGNLITRGGSYRQHKAIYDGMRTLNQNPSSGTVVAASPLFDTDSASDSWYMYHQMERDLERNSPLTVNNEWFDGTGVGVNNHTSMLGKLRMARAYYRLAMGLMGPAKGGFAMRRGPRITSATRSGTTITLHVTHDGGTALRKICYQEPGAGGATAWIDIDPSTKTDSEALSKQFAVYPVGQTFHGPPPTFTQGKLPFASTSVQLVDANTIRLFLASDPGAGVALDMYFGMDFGSYPGYIGIIVDDVLDGDGIDYGRPLCRTMEPVYVPSPTPAAQAITLDAPPVSPVSGGWMVASGSGSGAPVETGTPLYSSAIEISVNGGAYTVPDALTLHNDNKWAGLVRIPSTIAPGTSVTIAARRTGQTSPDASISVTVVNARTELPDPDGTGAIQAAAVANWDVLNFGSLWADTSKTTHAVHLGPIRLWADGLGDATNDLKTTKTDSGNAPFLDLRKKTYVYLDGGNLAKDRPYMMLGAFLGADGLQQALKADVANAAQQMIGDFTILAVGDQMNGNWLSISNGSFQPWIRVTGQNPGWVREIPSNSSRVICTGVQPGVLMDYQMLRYSGATKTMTLQNRSSTFSATLASVSQTNTNMTPITTLRQIWFGQTLDGYFGNGRFHQLVFFNRALTDAEVVALYAWAQVKWPFQ